MTATWADVERAVSGQGRGPRNGGVWDGDVRARSRRWFNAGVPDDEIPGLQRGLRRIGASEHRVLRPASTGGGQPVSPPPHGAGRECGRRRRPRSPARYVHDTAQWLGRVVNGWLNYYAVPTSARALRGFARRLLWIWLRTLRGRSQKDRTTIAGVARLAALYWPPVKVRHPWPTERFAVSHPR